MPFRFHSLATNVADALPGIMINNGVTWSNVGFLAGLPVGAGVEDPGGATTDFFNYDRQIQVPHPNSPSNEGYGIYVWNQDKIWLRENPGPAWVTKHTMTGMENLLSFGVHTGLYDMIGTDGRLYICGMYPGANADEMGYYVHDVQADTYQSGVQPALDKPTRMGHATPYQGKLYWASQGDLYILDPKRRTIAVMPTPTNDHRDKLVVLGTRLFLIGETANTLRLYEVYGSVFNEISNLGNYSGLGPSEWALNLGWDAAYVHSGAATAAGPACAPTESPRRPWSPSAPWP